MNTNDEAIPGRVVTTIKIPIRYSVVLALAVIVLTGAFWVLADARPIIAFFSASCAVAAGVLTAYYRGQGMKVSIEQRQQEIEQRRLEIKEAERARAFRFVERWNDPAFAQLRSDWRHILKDVEGKDDASRYNFIHNDVNKSTVVVDILNFYEEMGYSAKSGVVDSETLRQLFKNVVVRYFSAVAPWVHRHRTDRGAPTAYEHVEWLYNSWKNS